MLRFFAAPETVTSGSFREVFEAVRDGTVDAGVVPVESSLLGTIRENLDLLWSFDLPIAGEVSVPVRLALLGLPGERLETVERVYSIAAALAQADEFLRSRPWTIQTTYNTAGAAKQVAERGERGSAAVASARVAPIYGLEVLADDIQSGADNRTRFAVHLRGRATRRGSARRRSDVAVAGPPRTTLVFAVRNVPGSLHRSLGAFATRGLNLSRLESRPVDGARLALGVPVLGRPRRGPRRARVRGRARPSSPTRPRSSGSSARSRRPPRSSRTWNGGAGRSRAPPRVADPRWRG